MICKIKKKFKIHDLGCEKKYGAIELNYSEWYNADIIYDLNKFLCLFKKKFNRSYLFR